MSLKEYHLIELGAQCVFSDISINAVKNLKGLYQKSMIGMKYPDAAQFHVIDANYLPFANEQFDIIYGSSFVHHVDNLNKLFSEIYRVLLPNGKCRFLDGAYSVLWQTAKKTIFRPLQVLSHRIHGISVEDLRATKRGGYKREEIETILREFKFKSMVFERFSFFEYLLWRGTLKFGARYLRSALPLFYSLDCLLSKHTGFILNNGIRLVWGFDK
jgi:ubiquinone/menaquinone biosynthesis C-methylase UbiE